ncbi:MAG: hypothetical protein JJLCMIEE_02886 [Acidimicrobiales bacterium]|nr:MAG: acetyl-CoA acetyltransferase [Actinomycetota bacterium]MBV6509787.1 hypothetical protein [Acidimicrobiales bacterium]RIK04387.1 MAG: acetyl-CoA acetyltransferase [Acidobacteriota bacterium]
MSIDPARTPVIVGVGQVTEKDQLVTPVELMERAALSAISEARGIEHRLDAITVVNVINGGGDRPAGDLAARLGVTPRRAETTCIGGNTPQLLVTRAAEAIARGEIGAVLLAGAEAVNSARRGAEGLTPTAPAPDEVVGVERPGLHDTETAIGLILPAHVYAMFEGAIAAKAGRSFSEQRKHLGDLMAPFTKVAAANPYAWFPEERTAADLAEPSETNRVVADPYTKLMSAFLYVDQGAALLLTSLEVARGLGAADRAVFVWSGADVNDVWYPVARPDFTTSPAIAAAGAAALGAGGLVIDDVDLIDLYSCFPSAVEVGAEALGLALDDPRGLTITGGLPYFGGPGNNYPMHSIATAVERLRGTDRLALVSGLGWFTTKHSIGVYGGRAPADGFVKADTSTAQAEIDATAVPITDRPEGLATVDAATVAYGKDGGVVAAPVYATLADGTRAALGATRSTMAELAGVNLVGATVEIAGDGPFYRVL